MRAVMWFIKMVGYGLIFMIICQLFNGIVGVHTIVDLVLGICFVCLGEGKCQQH